MPTPTAILLGDFSGLQDFIFAVPERDGGQAKQLRARSFYLQLLTEAALQLTIGAADYSKENVLFCGASKFALRGPMLNEAQIAAFRALREELVRWLHQHMQGTLTLHLVAEQDESIEEMPLWQSVQWALLESKAQPATHALQAKGEWIKHEGLSLPLGSFAQDNDDRPIMPALNLLNAVEVGRALTTARWLTISSTPNQGSISLFGKLYATLHLDPQPPQTEGALYSLTPDAQHPSAVPRTLARHIPTSQQGEPITFEELAKTAQGDKKLGILAMDVDSLGDAFQQLASLESISLLSQRLERFFAGTLQEKIRTGPQMKSSIYTLFAGGDDFVAIGPWDKIMLLAGKVQSLFSQEFAAEQLTLSAGVAIVGPKFPVYRALKIAQERLDQAKSGGKNRIAAFGQVWEWEKHKEIDKSVHLWHSWLVPTDRFESGGDKRSWLHTLVETTVLFTQRSQPTATTSVEAAAIHRTRKALAHSRLLLWWKRVGRTKRADLNNWMGALLNDFPRRSESNTLFLPAIGRWALTLTRKSLE